MHQLKNTLIRRLRNKGMAPALIPGYIRCLSNSFYRGPHMTLLQVKNRLIYMGWDDFDLDYYTFQLAVDCLDAYGLKELEYKPVNWFNDIFLKRQSM